MQHYYLLRDTEIQTLILLSYSHIIQRQSNNKTTEKQKNHSWKRKDKIKSLSKLCAISGMGWGLFLIRMGMSHSSVPMTLTVMPFRQIRSYFDYNPAPRQRRQSQTILPNYIRVCWNLPCFDGIHFILFSAQRR